MRVGASRVAGTTGLAWSLVASVGCQAHLVVPEVASEEDDGDDEGPGPGSSPVPTSGPGTGVADTSTGVGEGTGGTGGTGGMGATDDTGGATTTTAPPGTCGDGVVDPGEGCDLSFSGNKDDGACTQSCAAAYCGDGLVWAGMEDCDAGPDNNDKKYGGCRADCAWGPRCGDGAVQPEEECDASAPVVEGAVPCEPDTCRLHGRVAFTTTETFSGAFGGIAGADARCVAAAEAAGLDNPGSFLAWVGDGVTAPASRFVEGIKAKGYPYARRDGQKLANDLDDLMATGLRVPLTLTEFGTPLPPSQYPRYAWTGVGIHGEPAGANCEEWTEDFYKYSGQVGQISPPSDSDADIFNWKIDGHWTKFAARLCSTPQHLYCFED